VRNGDKIEMIGEDTQTAKLSEGIYFNAGPARLPSFHHHILAYARQFGVPPEVDVNSSRSAYVVANNGDRLRMRTAINDTRCHVCELLAKAVSEGSLDQVLLPEDKAGRLPLLKFKGDLDVSFAFGSTVRAGFGTPPGAGPSSFETAPQPTLLRVLLGNQQLPMTRLEDTLYTQARQHAVERNHKSENLVITTMRHMRASLREVGLSPLGVTTAKALVG
jgi:monoamine oxidase